MMQESALLAGINLSPENREALNRVPLQPRLLMNRFRQRVTSLNFAIQTTPPPKRRRNAALLRLNLELFQLFLSVNFLDLARDRLQAALVHADLEDPEFQSQLTRQFNLLNDQIKQIQDI